MKHLSFLLFSLLLANCLSAQNELLEGNLTSETKSYWYNGQLFTSYKEYQTNGSKKAGTMSYLDLPLGAKNASVNGDLFVTKLSCFKDGKQQWTQTLGKTNTSRPPAMAQGSDGNLYVGEKQENKSAVTLYSFNTEGKELWSQTFDSLHNVHKIFTDESKNLSVLVSFNNFEKVQKGKSFTYVNKPVFFTITLNKANGKRVSKVHNQGPSYFCGMGFSTPILQCHEAHYFFKNDSLVYSRTDTLKMITLSQEELSKHRLLKVWGNTDEYYGVAQQGHSGGHKLLLYRWEGDNPLKTEADLYLSSRAEILGILKLESEGVAVVFAISGTISVKAFDENLKLLYSRILLPRIDDYIYSEAFIGPEGKIYLLLAQKGRKSRSLYLQKS